MYNRINRVFRPKFSLFIELCRIGFLYYTLSSQRQWQQCNAQQWCGGVGTVTLTGPKIKSVE